MRALLQKVKLLLWWLLDYFRLCVVHKATAGRVPTTELVNRIFTFCELYSGKTMFPYQEQFSKRVIRSILENDGEEITALFSRQSGKSETIALTVGGLMIILPQLANMPMFADDPRLRMFKDGLWVGIFAPSQRQAQITYGRIKSRIQCKASVAVMEDPEFRLSFTTSNGQTVALSNGSFATAISASDGANIEGESFKLIICEECFPKGTPILTSEGMKNIEDVKVDDLVYSYNHKNNKVELKRVERSFSQPLYGRKLVTITTESGKKITCTDNHKIWVANRNEYVRADSLQINDLMLSYMCTTQESGVAYNETVQSNDFGVNVRRRVNNLSRQEVFQKSSVCNKSICKAERLCRSKVSESETSLLTRAKDSAEQRQGERIVPCNDSVSTRIKDVPRLVLQRWKESNSKKHFRFNDRRSISLLVSRRWKFQRNDVHTHSMLHYGRKSDTSTMAEREISDRVSNTNRQEMELAVSILQRGSKEQVSQVDTSLCSSEYAVQNKDNGRESSLCSVRKNDYSLSSEENSLVFFGVQKDTSKGLYEEILQEEKIISIEIKEVEEIEVFDLTVQDNHNFFANTLLVHNCQDISNFKIQKSIHPMGAAYNATIVKIGTSTTFKGDFYDAIQRNKKAIETKTTHIRNHFEYDYTVASKYNSSYAKYVEKEKARLGENSDAFRMAYKLEWIIERGMFIDIAKFEANNGEPLLERVMYDKRATHVAGIDLGGKNDDTVVTMVEVDWNMPVIMESRVNDETGEEETYLAFNTYLKDWLCIRNEPDYEEQYPQIVDYLAHFTVARVVCDATREASLSHRLRANLKSEVIPYVFSTKSKSEVYKHLEKEIAAGRARVCMGEQTVQTQEYKDFLQQLGDLQKGYNGANLVVSHPDERDAHDDFPDSWALAVWGCSFKGEVNNTETKDRNRFTEKTRNELNDCRRRNRMTAKRR